MDRSRTLPTLLLALGLLSQPALAQVEVVAVEPDQGPKATNSWLRIGAHHMFESKLDGPGDVQRDSVVGWLGHRFDISDVFKIQTQLMYNGSFYDFDGSGGVLDWDDIHSATLAAIGAWRVHEQWTLLLGAVAKSDGEGGASFDDTLTGGALVGFQYVSSPDLQIGLAIGAISALENGGALIPLPLVSWRFAEDWEFTLGPILLDRLGYGGEIKWRPSKQWDVSTGITYTKRRFRLDENGSNADGIGQDTNAPLFVRVGFHPTPNIDLNLLGTLQMGGELRVETRAGNRVIESDYDPAPGIGVRAHFRF